MCEEKDLKNNSGNVLESPMCLNSLNPLPFSQFFILLDTNVTL